MACFIWSHWWSFHPFRGHQMSQKCSCWERNIGIRRDKKNQWEGTNTILPFSFFLNRNDRNAGQNPFKWGEIHISLSSCPSKTASHLQHTAAAPGRCQESCSVLWPACSCVVWWPSRHETIAYAVQGTELIPGPIGCLKKTKHFLDADIDVDSWNHLQTQAEFD